MSLQIRYSKEFAKELGKIAVYLPGEKVEVGDVLKFDHGKTLLGKARPLGSFKKITSLKNLGVSYPEPAFSNTPNTYRFSSKNAVNVEAGVNAVADLGSEDLPSGSGQVSMKFSSEGAIYFLGINCDSKVLDDLAALENEINTNGKKMVWDDTFLVTSITIAKKALIAQSRTKSSELVIAGDVNGIETGSVAVKAGAKLQVKKQSGDIFVKDWSDDVTVFMDVMKFEREVFGKVRGYRGLEMGEPPEEDPRIMLRKVNIKELLED